MWIIILAGILITVIYFLPTLIALQRSRQYWGIFTINILLGWTVIGWVVALVMAVWREKEQK